MLRNSISKVTRKDNAPDESILITNGRLLNPADNTDTITDIAIENGIVSAIGEIPKSFKPARTIDASGLWVTPGLLDLHVHLREPGREDKETIETGSAAAAAGGFTSIACMPNTDPVIDDEQKVQYIIRQNRGGYCRVYPVGSMTKQQEGKELAPYEEMMSAGAKAISDDGKSVGRSDLLKNALSYADMLNLPVFAHCEDSDLAKGAMNESSHSTRMGLRGTPTVAEDIDVARHIMLAEYLHVPVHICHVSSKGAIQQIRYAKERGVNVTAETAPHYFSFIDKDAKGYNTNRKVNPPLRSEEDRLAVTEALKDGTIDAIATDHAPHTSEDKEGEFDQAAFGVVGLETAIGAAITHLIETDILSPLQLIEKMSMNPHNILKVKGGNIVVGETADLTIIDPKKNWVVKADTFYSKGANSAYLDETLIGYATHTINGGKVTYERIV